MAKRYYIAYGSNLNISQMCWRCPSARIIGTSEVRDYRLLFKGSKTGAYLTIEPFEGGSVPVVAWEVSAEDELSLDRYEGYIQNHPLKTDCFLKLVGSIVKGFGHLLYIIFYFALLP